MASQKDKPHKSAASGAPKGTKKVRSGQGGLTAFMNRVYSVNTLHLLAGICQLTLGAAVVLIAILGLIRPFWLSSLFSILASLTTMVGGYFVYSALSNRNHDTLLRDAMRRIVEEQN